MTTPESQETVLDMPTWSTPAGVVQAGDPRTPTTPTTDAIDAMRGRAADALARIARGRRFAREVRASATVWRASHRWNPTRLHASRSPMEWARECDSIAQTHDAAVLNARADLAQVRATLARWRAAAIGYRRIARTYSQSANALADACTGLNR